MNKKRFLEKKKRKFTTYLITTEIKIIRKDLSQEKTGTEMMKNTIVKIEMIEVEVEIIMIDIDQEVEITNIVLKEEMRTLIEVGRIIREIGVIQEIEKNTKKAAITVIIVIEIDLIQKIKREVTNDIVFNKREKIIIRY